MIILHAQISRGCSVDFNKYVTAEIPYRIEGRDYDGIDCWGLVWLFYKEQMGVIVERYDDPYAIKKDYGIALTLMRVLKREWSRVEDPRDGDVVLAKDKGHPIHVGVYKHLNKMLNIREGKTPIIESLETLEWKHNLLGFYRLTR